MKIVLHKAEDRGSADIEWLNSRYSFSFADYDNPGMMGFGALRVINDDTIAQGQGFDLHPHQNMEIITIILEGSLEHTDNMGNKGILRSGDVQQISAGRGIMHSGFNASKKIPVSLLQIWIQPKNLNNAPSYSQRHFRFVDNNLVPLAAPELKGTLNIGQNAYISRGIFTERFFYRLHDTSNGVYVFVISGEIKIANIIASGRDGLGIMEASKFMIDVQQTADLLFIEVPE